MGDNGATTGTNACVVNLTGQFQEIAEARVAAETKPTGSESRNAKHLE